jgi:hypothetical protein
MRKGKIIMSFDEKDGSTTIEVQGVKGASCTALTRDMETAFGGKVVSDVKTAEYKEVNRERNVNVN